MTIQADGDPINYYAVLSDTTRLIQGKGWTLHRCRRHYDDSLRYVVFDQQHSPVALVKRRIDTRAGYTLDEILSGLALSPEQAVADPAHRLFEKLTEMHTGNNLPPY